MSGGSWSWKRAERRRLERKAGYRGRKSRRNGQTRGANLRAAVHEWKAAHA